jgi:hypothetical protein
MGTAYGIYARHSGDDGCQRHAGLFMLPASVIAGWLWERYGANMTFHAGAAFSVLAMLLPVFHKNHKRVTP